MLRFILNRLLQGLLVLFALYTITFFLIKAMPGDPFTGEKNISEEVKQEILKTGTKYYNLLLIHP